MIKIKFLLCFLLCSCFIYSQEEKKVYNRANFIKDSTYIVRVKLVRPQIRIDNRYAFYLGQTIALNGIDAGVILKNKLRLTAGYYMLSENLRDQDFEKNDIVYSQKLKMNYGSLNMEFIYLDTRFFRLGMPMEFGFGNNKLITENEETSSILETKSGFMVLADFGLSGTYKPIRWIGIRGSVGYRKNLINTIKGHSFNGFFTSVALAIDLREISKDVQIWQLKKKYKRLENRLGTAVDMITD